MNLNTEALNQLISHYQDDTDTMELISDTFDAFERYHAAIIKMETEKVILSHGNVDSNVWQERISALDQARTRAHNEVLMDIRILNRLAEGEGLQPIYAGMVSEEYPYRREVADAVMAYLSSLIDDRP